MDEVLSDWGCSILDEQTMKLTSKPQAEIDGESTLGRGNSRCKGPEAGMGFMCSREQEKIWCDRNIVGVIGRGRCGEQLVSGLAG